MFWCCSTQGGVLSVGVRPNVRVPACQHHIVIERVVDCGPQEKLLPSGNHGVAPPLSFQMYAPLRAAQWMISEIHEPSMGVVVSYAVLCRKECRKHKYPRQRAQSHLLFHTTSVSPVF